MRLPQSPYCFAYFKVTKKVDIKRSHQTHTEEVTKSGDQGLNESYCGNPASVRASHPPAVGLKGSQCYGQLRASKQKGSEKGESTALPGEKGYKRKTANPS